MTDTDTSWMKKHARGMYFGTPVVLGCAPFFYEPDGGLLVKLLEYPGYINVSDVQRCPKDLEIENLQYERDYAKTLLSDIGPIKHYHCGKCEFRGVITFEPDWPVESCPHCGADDIQEVLGK